MSSRALGKKPEVTPLLREVLVAVRCAMHHLAEAAADPYPGDPGSWAAAQASLSRAQMRLRQLVAERFPRRW